VGLPSRDRGSRLEFLDWGGSGEAICPDRRRIPPITGPPRRILTIEQLFRNAGPRALSTYSKPTTAAGRTRLSLESCTARRSREWLSNLDAARIAALERDVVRGWQPWSDDGGMRCEQGMNVAKAHKWCVPRAR
jgi:hypothetical protein